MHARQTFLSAFLLASCTQRAHEATTSDAAIVDLGVDRFADVRDDREPPAEPTVDPFCVTNGCLRSLSRVGSFARDEIEPYLQEGVVIDNGYTVYVIEYFTNGATSLATVTIPFRAELPVGGFPIVVNAHGTSGLDDACKLSGTVLGSGLAGLFGARGAIGVAPDYPGLGTPGLHPYLVAQVEGAAVLDSLRAASTLARMEAVRISDRFAIVGLSQGGHAVLSAARMHSTYAPELDVRAFAAAAPATVWLEQWRLGVSLDGPHLGYHAMAFYAWADFYRYGGPPLWAPSMRGRIDTIMRSSCVYPLDEARPSIADALGSRADELFDSAFLAAYRSGDFGSDYELFTSAFSANRIGPYAQTAPLAIWQGDLDDTVPVAATTQVVAALMEGGVEVDYRIVEGGRHDDVAFGFVAAHQLRTDESVAWVRQNLDR